MIIGKAVKSKRINLLFVLVIIFTTSVCMGGMANAITLTDSDAKITNYESDFGDGINDDNASSSGPYYHQIYSATSTDGISWIADGTLLFDHASVPGAVYFNNKVYLYYVNAEDPEHEKLSVGISEDCGVTFTILDVQISGSNSPYPVDPNPIIDGDQIRLTYLGNFMQGETNKIVTATSPDGINFTEDGVIFTGDVYDPDLFYDEAGGQWVLFVSAGSPGVIKATASSPTSSFTEDTSFSWTAGGISSTHKIGDKYYTYYAGDGICVAEYINGKLSNIADGIVDFPGLTADPTVAVFGPNDYKMFFKTVVGEEPPTAPEVIPHEPIYIDGNDNFTETNGVVSGDGTESNPYIIEGWDISASTTNGIEIKNTDVYFIIRNCEIHNNSDGGIYFQNVDNSTVSSNYISDNLYGIFLNSSHYNYFDGNDIRNSTNGDGFSMDNSNYNTLVNNTIESNKYAGIGFWSSSNNLAYHNNLIGNLQNNGYDDTGTNSWDNGTEGNYWGDYTGVDEDKDGIGDTPYEIPGGAGASDNYPLMEPYSPNNPPNRPSNPFPANEATGVSTPVTLSVTASDLDGDTMTVTFYDASDDSVIGMDADVASGSRAEVVWSGLAATTTYSWYARANDGELDSSQSDTWSFTTAGEWAPWDYDEDDSSYIEIGELLDAISDYIGGEITISQLLETISLYISHTPKP